MNEQETLRESTKNAGRIYVEWDATTSIAPLEICKEACSFREDDNYIYLTREQAEKLYLFLQRVL